jgi:hypothetical protein
MKKMVALAILVVLALALATPASAHVSGLVIGGGKTELKPWSIYADSTKHLDIRYNFEQHDSWGVFANPRLTLGNWFLFGNWIIAPAAGIIFDEHNALTLELNSEYKKRKFSYIGIDQAVVSRGNVGLFVYQNRDLLYMVSRYTQIGIGEQMYWDSSHLNSIDVGPEAKVKLGRIYLKLWPTIGYTDGYTDKNMSKKFFIGAGIVY